MSEPPVVSRRASLKRLSAAGAAIVLGGATSASGQEPKPAASGQAKPAVNVVDVAADRMAKGHS